MNEVFAGDELRKSQRWAEHKNSNTRSINNKSNEEWKETKENWTNDQSFHCHNSFNRLPFRKIGLWTRQAETDMNEIRFHVCEKNIIQTIKDINNWKRDDDGEFIYLKSLYVCSV